MIERLRRIRNATARCTLALVTVLGLTGASCESPSSPALRERLVKNEQALKNEAERTYDGLISILETVQKRDATVREFALEQCRKRVSADAQRYINLAWARERKVQLKFEDLAWQALEVEFGEAFVERVSGRVEPALRAEQASLRELERRREDLRSDPMLADQQIARIQSLSKGNAALLGLELDSRDELAERIGAARREFRSMVHQDFSTVRTRIGQMAENACTIDEDLEPLGPAIARIEKDKASAMDLFDEQIRGHAALDADANKKSPIALVVTGSVSAVADEVGKLPFIGEKLKQVVDTKGREMAEAIDSKTKSLTALARTRIDGIVDGFGDRLDGKAAELAGR